MRNIEIVELLKQIAAAYLILGENRFKIIAYEKAADSIEHLTYELKDLWKDGKLEQIPGVGPAISKHLDELFSTGKVKHFTEVLTQLPGSIFPLLRVPGLGPKKAFKLVVELQLNNVDTVVSDVEQAGLAHKIEPIEGFGARSEALILENIQLYKKGQIKENRLVLPEADTIAENLLSHMKKHPDVIAVDRLGSLRRQVSTIGDIDISVSTENPADVLKHFLTYPYEKLVDHGPSGATIILHNGRQADLRVQKPSAYGAMLQYFTGSKHHNIHLRTLALQKGLSLNEYGIKDIKTGKTKEYADEIGFYKAVGLPWIAPELREDMGEIDAALQGALPNLVKLEDIKGDLHIHTNYSFPTSHDIGGSHIHEHLNKAVELGYEYIGISDHNPKNSGMSTNDVREVMKARKSYYEQEYYSWSTHVEKRVQMLLMCEVDILHDGNLALPNEAFEYVDGVIVSLHSSFTQDRDAMTERIIKALTAHPKVRIFGHPTGRLLGKRDGVDARWDKVFAVCKERDIALEINAAGERLDLPDTLVHAAIDAGVRFTINTDAHHVDGMHAMRFGVSVARRGWAQKRDILNSLSYNQFVMWFTRKES